MTGGRIKRIKDYIGNEPFMLTYGDAVGDVDLNGLVTFHKTHGKVATLSTYNFGQKKGVLDIDKKGQVQAFREKSDLDGDLIKK
jgi:glucose-1-phosphate cytidylyltransferase